MIVPVWVLKAYQVSEPLLVSRARPGSGKLEETAGPTAASADTEARKDCDDECDWSEARRVRHTAKLLMVFWIRGGSMAGAGLWEAATMIGYGCEGVEGGVDHARDKMPKVVGPLR